MVHAWQNGWGIDPNVFRQRLQYAYRTMKETGRIMMDTIQGNSRRIHDKLTDWSEVFRGERIIRDRTTGWESSTDIGWVNETVDELNRAAGFEKYEQVPLREWLRGR